MRREEEDVWDPDLPLNPKPCSKADCSHNIRTGLETEAIATALIDNLHCLQAKPPQYATRNDWYTALAYTVRDRMVHRYIATVESIAATNTDAKLVAYLSAEFLTGPLLGNSLINLGIWHPVEEALSRSGRTCPISWNRRRSPGWAMAAWAAWLPVTWTRWRRSTLLQWATASATSSASSTR